MKEMKGVLLTLLYVFATMAIWQVPILFTIPPDSTTPSAPVCVCVCVYVYVKKNTKGEIKNYVCVCVCVCVCVLPNKTISTRSMKKPTAESRMTVTGMPASARRSAARKPEPSGRPVCVCVYVCVCV